MLCLPEKSRAQLSSAERKGMAAHLDKRKAAAQGCDGSWMDGPAAFGCSQSVGPITLKAKGKAAPPSRWEPVEALASGALPSDTHAATLSSESSQVVVHILIQGARPGVVWDACRQQEKEPVVLRSTSPMYQVPPRSLFLSYSIAQSSSPVLRLISRGSTNTSRNDYASTQCSSSPGQSSAFLGPWSSGSIHFPRPLQARE